MFFFQLWSDGLFTHCIYSALAQSTGNAYVYLFNYKPKVGALTFHNGYYNSVFHNLGSIIFIFNVVFEPATQENITFRPKTRYSLILLIVDLL